MCALCACPGPNASAHSHPVNPGLYDTPINAAVDAVLYITEAADSVLLRLLRTLPKLRGKLARR